MTLKELCDLLQVHGVFAAPDNPRQATIAHAAADLTVIGAVIEGGEVVWMTLRPLPLDKHGRST